MYNSVCGCKSMLRESLVAIGMCVLARLIERSSLCLCLCLPLCISSQDAIAAVVTSEPQPCEFEGPECKDTVNVCRSCSKYSCSATTCVRFLFVASNTPRDSALRRPSDARVCEIVCKRPSCVKAGAVSLKMSEKQPKKSRTVDIIGLEPTAPTGAESDGDYSPSEDDGPRPVAKRGRVAEPGAGAAAPAAAAVDHGGPGPQRWSWNRAGKPAVEALIALGWLFLW